MAYVYRHVRTDKNQPFYIGIGTDNSYRRSRSKCNRNRYWKNITNKYPNYIIEIIEECLVHQLHEREYYWKMHYKSVENGLNCDYFDNSGGPRSEETKRRISEGTKGKKRSEETKQKLKKPKTEEHKQNISKAKQNISEETKRKISESKLGKKWSEEHIKNIIKGKQKPVLQYDLEGNFIKEWEGVKVAAAYLGCDPTTITANLRGKTKKGFGYIWKRKTI
jgi:group I intron endonuclease